MYLFIGRHARQPINVLRDLDYDELMRAMRLTVDMVDHADPLEELVHE